MRYAILCVVVTLLAAAIADYTARKSAKREARSLKEQLQAARDALNVQEAYSVVQAKRIAQQCAVIDELNYQLKGTRG